MEIEVGNWTRPKQNEGSLEQGGRREYHRVPAPNRRLMHSYFHSRLSQNLK